MDDFDKLVNSYDMKVRREQSDAFAARSIEYFKERTPAQKNYAKAKRANKLSRMNPKERKAYWESLSQIQKKAKRHNDGK